MAETLQQLLRSRADDDGTAVKHADTTISWRTHIEDAGRQAAGLDRVRPGGAQHVLQALPLRRVGGIEEETALAVG